MPKPITIEMLEAMSLDQRKTLHRNALGLDTDAAHSVLALLAEGDLLGPAKAAPSARAKPAKPRAAAKKTPAPKPVAAVYGRQA